MSLTFEPTTTSNLSSSNLSSNLSSSNEMTNTAIVYWTPAYAHASAILHIFLGVLGAASNGLVFFSVVARPKLRTIDNVILAHVALVQLLYFATSHPIAIWTTLSYGVWRDDDAACQASAFFNTTLLPLCWIAHVSLNFEKCVRVRYNYQKRLTMQWGFSVIIASWIMVLAMSTTPFWYGPAGPYKVLRTRLACGLNSEDLFSLYPRAVLFSCWITTLFFYVSICSTFIHGEKRFARRSDTEVEAAARQRRRTYAEFRKCSTHTSFTAFITVVLFTNVFICPAIAQMVFDYGRDADSYQGYRSIEFNIDAMQLFLIDVLFIVNPLIYSLETKRLRNHLVEITNKFLRCRRGNDSKLKDAS